MFVVYWLERDTDANPSDGAGRPLARAFGNDQMKLALEFMEQLRRRQRSGEPIGFVTMCSENPDSVGPPGVADPAADYNWKKRRP